MWFDSIDPRDNTPAYDLATSYFSGQTTLTNLNTLRSVNISYAQDQGLGTVSSNHVFEARKR